MTSLGRFPEITKHCINLSSLKVLSKKNPSALQLHVICYNICYNTVIYTVIRILEINYFGQ